MENPELSKNDILFAHLVLMFQSAAMQYMGKSIDPELGKINRDLAQAAQSIDMIEMLRVKCKGNLSPEEDKFLAHVLSELKINYVDEVNRKDVVTESSSPSEQTDAE